MTSPKTLSPEDHAAAVSLERERKKFEQWCDDELPQFFSGRQPTWSTVEANVKLHCWEAWRAALAAQPLSGQQRERLTHAEREQIAAAANYSYDPSEVPDTFGAWVVHETERHLSASPVAMPDEGKAVASRAAEAQEQAKLSSADFTKLTWAGRRIAINAGIAPEGAAGA